MDHFSVSCYPPPVPYLSGIPRNFPNSSMVNFNDQVSKTFLLEPARIEEDSAEGILTECRGAEEGKNIGGSR